MQNETIMRADEVQYPREAHTETLNLGRTRHACGCNHSSNTQYTRITNLNFAPFAHINEYHRVRTAPFEKVVSCMMKISEKQFRREHETTRTKRREIRAAIRRE